MGSRGGVAARGRGGSGEAEVEALTRVKGGEATGECGRAAAGEVREVSCNPRDETLRPMKHSPQFLTHHNSFAEPKPHTHKIVKEQSPNQNQFINKVGPLAPNLGESITKPNLLNLFQS